MLNIEALPWSVYVDFLIWDRLQRLALHIDCGVPEILIWTLAARRSPLFQNLCRYGGEFSFQGERIKQVLQSTETGCQHVHVAIAVFVHFFNVVYNIHSVITAVVQPSHEG